MKYDLKKKNALTVPKDKDQLQNSSENLPFFLSQKKSPTFDFFLQKYSKKKKLMKITYMTHTRLAISTIYYFLNELIVLGNECYGEMSWDFYFF